MKNIFIMLFSLATMASATAQKTSLFNGSDLEGWNIHGTEKWYVAAGVLICEFKRIVFSKDYIKT